MKSAGLANLPSIAKKPETEVKIYTKCKDNVFQNKILKFLFEYN